MTFSPGQTVVHPQHGTALIDAVEEREFQGKKTRFLVLTAPSADLTVKVPEDRCEEIGLRSVINQDQVSEIMTVLGTDAGPQKGHWSQRLKMNQARLRSGDPQQVAEVLRDLAAKSQSKALSPAEKRLFDKARQLLCSEVAAAMSEDCDAIEAKIDGVLGLEPATV